MKYVAALALCMAFAAANESSARADEDPAPNVEKPKTHWYGWQTLAIDGPAFAVTFGALFAKSHGLQQGLAVSGVSAFALGPPLVHAFHGRYAAMGIDFGLRVALPLIGGGFGYAIGVSSVDTSKSKNLGDAINSGITSSVNLELALFGGLALGVIGAVGIDAALLAEEPVKEAPKAITWAPTFAPRAGGATAGVAGTF